MHLAPSGIGRLCQMGTNMAGGGVKKANGAVRPIKAAKGALSPASAMNGVVRPIKTTKDYSGAASIVDKIAGQPDRETVAEKRLQSLLKEMEKFDGDGEDADEEMSEGGYAGPRRRWSDESTDSD